MTVNIFYDENYDIMLILKHRFKYLDQKYSSVCGCGWAWIRTDMNTYEEKNNKMFGVGKKWAI